MVNTQKLKVSFSQIHVSSSKRIRIYRNFRSFTRTADYPHRPIIAYGEKKSQQITCTGG